MIDATGALVATIPANRADAIEVPLPAPMPRRCSRGSATGWRCWR
ncbi:hypothetical protein ACVOMT_14625 [Sphingomonas panni]